MWVEELVNIRPTGKQGEDQPHGGFGREMKRREFHQDANSINVQFFYCRDIFQRLVLRNKAIQKYYFVGSKNISEFFDVVEDRLKLSDQQRTKFGPTNRDYAIWFLPGEWWWIEYMRKSLFTIFLRCGNSYTGNFTQALHDCEYSSNTMSAVEYFLDGNTHYKSRPGTWYNNFENKTEAEIKKMLVPPSSKI